MEKYIYTGNFYLDLESKDIRLTKAKYPYHVSVCDEYLHFDYALKQAIFLPNNNLEYHADGYLDRELRINENLIVFYSTSEKAVDEWLEKTRRKFLIVVNKMVEMSHKLNIEVIE